MTSTHHLDRAPSGGGASAAVVLERFFAIERARVTDRTAETYTQVESRLDTFLYVVDVTRWIGVHPASLLEAERQFTPEGAFLRLFGLDELVCCLPEFLSDVWLSPVPVERRAQIALVGRLLEYLRRRSLIDFHEIACAYYEARQAVYDARDAA